MSKKILAFGASSSKNSINKKFSQFAAKHFNDSEITLIDLNDFELPIYSIDKEQVEIPELAHKINNIIQSSDAYIISFAEHNGAYTAAYKNIFDWVTRINKNVWNNKPMLLLSTSPGPNGASLVLNIAHKTYAYSNSNTIATFSLPSFYDNFDDQKGIIDDKLNDDFNKVITTFSNAL